MIKQDSIYKLFDREKDLSHSEYFVEVDNRKLTKNSLFVAIVGERYNPLEHLDAIVRSGCELILYEKSVANDKLVKPYDSKLKFISCNNIVSKIAELGHIIAKDFQERSGKIVGISGSNGKTTTKEMLAHILSQNLGIEKVIFTQKNNNNHLGVPFTLFQIRPETEYALVELGSNSPGEIEFLCKMINADIGITTNIGDTHLEFFDTRENVFKEEAILADYAKTFFVNSDDEFLSTLVTNKNSKTYGTKGEDYLFKINASSVEVNNLELNNPFITGTHNFHNLALAFSVATYLIENKEEGLLQAANSFKPTKNRSEWIDWLNGSRVYLDAYNANPSSMKVALLGFLDYLKINDISPEDSCVILGDMNELGKNTNALHSEVGEFALKLGFGHYVFIGSFANEYTQVSNENIQKFSQTTQANMTIQKLSKHFKYLFLKGSRSLQLERITDIK